MKSRMSKIMRSRALRALVAELFSVIILACISLPFGPGDVEVRVENGTELTFTQVRIYFEPMQTFTDLEPGERTPYVTVDKAYSIATVVVVTATDSARIQVIDFVGEEPLESGRYTFTIFSPDPNDPLMIAERVKKD